MSIAEGQHVPLGHLAPHLTTTKQQQKALSIGPSSFHQQGATNPNSKSIVKNNKQRYQEGYCAYNSSAIVF